MKKEAADPGVEWFFNLFLPIRLALLPLVFPAPPLKNPTKPPATQGKEKMEGYFPSFLLSA